MENAEEIIALSSAVLANINISISSLGSSTPSRERSLAITKLQEGAMWLIEDIKRGERLKNLKDAEKNPAEEMAKPPMAKAKA